MTGINPDPADCAHMASRFDTTFCTLGLLNVVNRTYQDMRDRKYVGIDKDTKGAMNPTGNVIRDAWLFGLIPETETCEGWNVQGIDSLYAKVSHEWDKYGHLVCNLPPELAEKHREIYDAAVARARQMGWNPEELLDDD